MFQILEHMDGMDELMKRLNLIGARNCHIFMAVPNARRIAYNDAHCALPDLPPNHIGGWMPRAFEAVAG